MDNKLLSDQYYQALKDLDTVYLDPQRQPKGLSGLFLPGVSDNYHLAKNKIMIVGRETRAWNVVREGQFSNLENYIATAMNTHQHFFKGQLDKKNTKGRAFHNFTRSIAKKCGKEGLVYANLFCFSWNKKNPARAGSYFKEIKKYSKILLKIQIQTLKPQIIIFANGAATVKYRREFFPVDGPNSVCKSVLDCTSGQIPNRQLWEFELYESIRCFRINHPSSRNKDSAKARNFLINNLLPPE